MSQSDYIKYKKTSVQLKINEFPPIHDSNTYDELKNYALENTIQNSKITYNQLIPSNKIIVFSMEKSTVNTCLSNFPLCQNTNSRANRRPLLITQYDPKPLRPLIRTTVNPNCICNLST